MRTRSLAGRPATLAAALALAVILPACGGGSGGGGNTPSTLPAAPAPVRSLVVQGTFNLASVTDARGARIPYDAQRHEFSTSGTGTLEVNADWTFPGSQMGVVVFRGSCSFTQLFAETCAEVGGAFPSAKPARVTLNNLVGGTYTVIIANINNYAESGNYQVYLTR